MQVIVLGKDGELSLVESEPFSDEAKLQRLIADYPSVLLHSAGGGVGSQIWTIGVEVGTDSGSIDVLALDDTGRVWVVETKLAKSPEVKKQVVGQVLAYAAEVAAWSSDELEAAAVKYLKRIGHPANSLVEYLSQDLESDEPSVEAEEIVRAAVEMLGAGRMTAVVVVDQAPPTLRRLVEFVNSHSDFDLLAVQVDQVPVGETTVVVPTVFGTTTKKQSSPSSPSLEEALEQAPDDVKQLGALLQDLASERGWSTRPMKKSLKYVTANGLPVAYFYPGFGLGLSLQALLDAGLGDRVEEVKQQLEAILGKPVAPQYPMINTQKALETWDRLRDWLIQVENLLRQASGSKPDGPAG
jgi:hypothetical protein